MSDSKPNTNAAPEIEVTPEMIEAGRRAFYDFATADAADYEDINKAFAAAFRAVLREAQRLNLT